MRLCQIQNKKIGSFSGWIQISNKSSYVQISKFIFLKNKMTALMAKHEENSSLYLEDLPNEILLKIFSYLETSDVFHCGQMSKRIRKISHDGRKLDSNRDFWAAFRFLINAKVKYRGRKWNTKRRYLKHLIARKRFDSPRFRARCNWNK